MTGRLLVDYVSWRAGGPTQVKMGFVGGSVERPDHNNRSLMNR